MRAIALAGILLVGGCGFLDRQLSPTPGGGPAPIVTEAKQVAGATPYGELLLAAAALASGIYGAIKGHSADAVSKSKDEAKA